MGGSCRRKTLWSARWRRFACFRGWARRAATFCGRGRSRKGRRMVKHWLVSQFIAEVEYDGAPRVIWEFAGIFSTKEAAIMACRDKYYAVSEVTLNQTVPHE